MALIEGFRYEGLDHLVSKGGMGTEHAQLNKSYNIDQDIQRSHIFKNEFQGKKFKLFVGYTHFQEPVIVSLKKTQEKDGSHQFAILVRKRDVGDISVLKTFAHMS